MCGAKVRAVDKRCKRKKKKKTDLLIHCDTIASEEAIFVGAEIKIPTIWLRANKNKRLTSETFRSVDYCTERLGEASRA